MIRAALIEAIAIYWPLSVCLLLHFLLKKKLTKRHYVAAMMSSTWLAASVPWINLIAIKLQLWSYHTEHHYQILGLPLSLYLSWILFWGVLPALLYTAFQRFGTRSFYLLLLALLIVDIISMPLLEPILLLEKNWLIGELLLIIFTLIPSLLLTRYVITDSYSGRRASLIAVAFIFLLLTIIPYCHPAIQFSPIITWLSLNLIEQALAIFAIMIVAVPGIAAVQEFAIIGKGTPIPQDPPKHLVTTGVYSFIKNPIQLSMVLTLPIWAILFSPYIHLMTLVAIIYCVGIARWSEGIDLTNRYPDHWQNYRSTVSSWFPSITPSWSADLPAEVYINHQCKICKSIAKWILTKHPTALIIKDASEWDGAPLTRMTYLDPNSPKDSQSSWAGVLAMARVFQHLHLGYAWLGWFISIPILSHIIQAAMDASGLGTSEETKQKK